MMTWSSFSGWSKLLAGLLIISLLLIGCPKPTPTPTPTPTPAIGWIEVSSMPAGAEVYLNDVYKGITPLKIEAPPGKYTLTIRKPDYEPRSEEIEITSGKTLSLSVSLSPLPAPTPTALTLVVGGAQVGVGEIASLPITLYIAEKGLSGFDLTAFVADERVAEIVGVELPDFGLTEVGELPAVEVRVRAADLKDIVSAGARESVLAQLKLKGKAKGSTEIRLSLKAMDDDQGGAMSPQLISGKLEVK